MPLKRLEASEYLSVGGISMMTLLKCFSTDFALRGSSLLVLGTMSSLVRSAEESSYSTQIRGSSGREWSVLVDPFRLSKQ